MRWFRFYDDVVHDPKVQRLPAPLFRFWVNVLCLASKHDGVLPPVGDIAFIFRITDKAAIKGINELKEALLIDETPEGLTPHDWSEYQYDSDSSIERVRRYRDKRVANGMNRGDAHTKHRAALMKRDGGRCVYCGGDKNLVIDHMVPISQGGTDDPDNLAMACKVCNSGKSGRTPEEAGFTVTAPAMEAMSRYRNKPVTVTVTAQNRTDSDTDSESDSDSETEQRRVPIADSFAVAVRQKLIAIFGEDQTTIGWHWADISALLAAGYSESELLAAGAKVKQSGTVPKTPKYFEKVMIGTRIPTAPKAPPKTDFEKRLEAEIANAGR